MVVGLIDRMGGVWLGWGVRSLSCACGLQNDRAGNPMARAGTPAKEHDAVANLDEPRFAAERIGVSA